MKSTVQGSLSASAGELPVLRPRPLPPTASHGTGAKSDEVTSKVNCVFQMFLVESGGAVTARAVKLGLSFQWHLMALPEA